jgi:hypothetical protein
MLQCTLIIAECVSRFTSAACLQNHAKLPGRERGVKTHLQKGTVGIVFAAVAPVAVPWPRDGR